MYYINIFVSILLIVVFFLLFGLKSISRFMEKGVSQSLHEEFPEKIPSPGLYNYKNKASRILNVSGCILIFLLLYSLI